MIEYDQILIGEVAMKNILVIGSSNTDMIVKTEALPLPGQTLLGGEFMTFGGGKGANQAVAAKRAGANTQFVVSVGDDDLGRAALAIFAGEEIQTDYAQVVEGARSGVAMIFVDGKGENSIAVAPGANDKLTPEYIDAYNEMYDGVSLLLIQLETPMPTVERAVALAKEKGVPAVINPAPAARLSDVVLNGLYCITPNETEAEALTGCEITDIHSAINAAHVLRIKGVQNVIITLGSKGALLVNADGVYHQLTEKVDVVDTTAAGDTFNGILVAALSDNKSMEESLALAVKGASLSVQKQGAISSIPYRDEYE